MADAPLSIGLRFKPECRRNAPKKATMPVRLDKNSADFDQRFAAFLGAKREASADVERATRAIVDDVDHSAKPPPDGPPGDGQDPDPDATTTGEPHAATRYQPIPVTIED